jgi:hypothetical protein
MFGLNVKEPHIGYIGWRAILHRGFVDIVPDRTTSIGNKESQDRLITWVNKPMIFPPPPKRKRPKKITPWKQMHEAAKYMSGASDVNWEVNEGSFVLRANPCASYGYLYIALFERDSNVCSIEAGGDAHGDKILEK